MKLDRQKIENAIDRMTLMDDDFMCQVFDENFPGVELVLSIILEQPGIKVTDIRVQHEYRNLKKRSVRLDITAKDSAGRIMDIEVQRDNDVCTNEFVWTSGGRGTTAVCSTHVCSKKVSRFRRSLTAM